jgi:glycosyltransferase involved in cell wall biosynthesis
MPVRVTQAKNIEFAMRTVHLLKERGVRIKLVVTGPPDPHDEKNLAYFHSLKRLQQELGLEPELCFVFESGPDTGIPYTIGADVVGELYRVSDLVFLPSHREGFGIPILEAGLAGVPIASTNIPAAREIGGRDVLLLDLQAGPEGAVEQVLLWMQSSLVYHLRKRVRERYTWQAIFRRQIQPLLDQGVRN